MATRGVLAKYDPDYTTLKTKVDEALTRTGTSFTWTSTATASHQLILATQMGDLKSAVDAAWARYCNNVQSYTNCSNYGHNSHNTCDSHQGNYGNHPCETHQGNHGHNSCSGNQGNYSHNTCSANQGNNGNHTCEAHQGNYAHNTCSSNQGNYGNHSSNSGCSSERSHYGHYGSYCTRVNSRKG